MPTNMAGLVFGLCIFLTTALVVNSECPPESGMVVNNTVKLIYNINGQLRTVLCGWPEVPVL